MIHKKHPYITVATISVFTVSGISTYLLGWNSSYLYSFTLPGTTPTELITNVFLKNPVIGLLTFAALAIGVLQYSGEGYNEIEL